MNQLFGLALVLGGFFALIALMPRFDEKWDHQEDDRD